MAMPSDTTLCHKYNKLSHNQSAGYQFCYYICSVLLKLIHLYIID